MSDAFLRSWEPQMVALVLLGVLFLVWRGLKAEGINMSLSKSGSKNEGYLDRVNNAVMSHRDGMGSGMNEAPVFWNAGSVAAIAEAQAKGIGEEVDSGADEGLENRDYSKQPSLDAHMVPY